LRASDEVTTCILRKNFDEVGADAAAAEFRCQIYVQMRGEFDRGGGEVVKAAAFIECAD
jgi:hypothetical protein